MSFITKEEAEKSRTAEAKPLDLQPYIRLEKKVLVRELSFNASVRLHSATGSRDQALIKTLAEAVLHPETKEPLSADDLNEIFELTSLTKGKELLDKLQELALPKKQEEAAGN